MQGPLSGIRVLALENALAGPFGSMILGDLGAEVIKVEPTQGDIGRVWAGARYNGEPVHYLAYNRNKKGIILDLRTPSGKAAALDLIKISDIVWDNFRPGAMERLGLGYQDLKAINLKVIAVHLTGFGPSGPYKDRPSNDSVASGMSGIMSVTGEPGGRPIKPGPAVPDLANALYGVIGALAALRHREATGEGQEVNTSLLGAGIAFMSFHIAEYTIGNNLIGPLGSGYPMSAPYGAYKAKEGYVVMGVNWPRVARIIGADALIDDPRFKTLEDRVKNRWELNEEIEKYLSVLTAEEWLPIMYANDIVAGPLYNVAEVVEVPQVKHMHMITPVKHALGGEIKLVNSPVTMESMEGEHASPPTLGQHTQEVLKGLLGYSDEKINELEAEREANAKELEAHTRRRR